MALAQRLLTDDPTLRLCLCCRNHNKAEEARRILLAEQPKADITLVTLDTSSNASVITAARTITATYNHVDLIYCNAGIMPSPSVDWMVFIKNLLAADFTMFKTGSGILVQSEDVTTDGLQATFATNVFGHFLLLEELIEARVLGKLHYFWGGGKRV